MGTSYQRHLIVRADGSMRVVSRKGRLRDDEVSYKLLVRTPKAWGREAGTIDITLPEPPTVTPAPSSAGFVPDQPETM